jgi:hypothetical protein
MEIPTTGASNRTTAAYGAPFPRAGWLSLGVTIILALSAVVLLSPSRLGNPPSLGIRHVIKNRAKIDLFDDFRSGLDRWQNNGKASMAWSYDQNGFVIPGNLSLLTSTMSLTDYDVDSVVQVEKKAFGLVFRASGPESYHAAKLVIEDPSVPMSSIVVERYTVINGVESAREIVSSPTRFPQDTLYRVHLHVHGDSFTLYIQDRLIAFWSDARLLSGGVGFFCNRGERARIASVRVSHNADMLGNLCALIAPLL